MPHYYFDTADGSRSQDTEGLELAGDESARVEAIKFAGACITLDPHLLSETREFKVEVRDAERRLLFLVTTFITTDPDRRGQA